MSRLEFTDSGLERFRNQLAPIKARWQALGEREKSLVLLGGLALGLLLLWNIAVQPAWRQLRELPPQIDRVDVELQQMRQMAQEAKDLRETPGVAAAQAAQALQAATERLGTAGKLSVSGERIVLTLSGVTGTQLQEWLGEVRGAARARPIESQLQRGPKGYSGTVVLTVGGSAS